MSGGQHGLVCGRLVESQCPEGIAGELNLKPGAHEAAGAEQPPASPS